MKAAAILLAISLTLSVHCRVLEPAADEEDLGKWTVSGFRKHCLVIENRCDVSFDLADDEEGVDPTHCAFTVNGTQEIPAVQIGYTNIKCQDEGDYLVSGSWDAAGFSVILIENGKDGLMSFFGFEDRELADGAEAEPKSTRVLRSRPPEEHDDQGAEAGEEADLNYAAEWTLTDVTRVVTQGEERPSMALSFNVEHPDSEPLVCVAMGHGEPGEDLKTMSFYAVECVDTEWLVSWGYDHEAEEDVAVVTLMNKYRDRRAYFGFRHVNDGLELGDNGPEQTHPY